MELSTIQVGRCRLVTEKALRLSFSSETVSASKPAPRRIDAYSFGSHRRHQLRPHLFGPQEKSNSARSLLARRSASKKFTIVSFVDHDLGYFDLETRVLEPLENPFGPKVLPM
jgi:hypothetical protein